MFKTSKLQCQPLKFINTIPRDSRGSNVQAAKPTMDKHALISSLIEEKICLPAEVNGASPHEVSLLERSANLKFPLQYKEFLVGVGNGAGEFFVGTDIFLRSLDGLQDAAVYLLEENNEDFQLPKDAFVFSMHQGYEFKYFKGSEGNDPPIYQYVEGMGPPKLVWNSFSDFLKDSIAQQTRTKSA